MTDLADIVARHQQQKRRLDREAQQEGRNMTTTTRKTSVVAEGVDLGGLIQEAERYLRKPRRRLLQMDAWADYPPGDSVMVPDDDGDVRMAGIGTDRQMSDTTVRILIDPEADPAAVLRVLEKQVEWYRKGHAGLLNVTNEPPF